MIGQTSYISQSFPREFKDTFNTDQYPTVEDWAKTILDKANSKEYNIKDADKHKDALQVSVEFLKKEWITDTLDKLVKLDEKHNGSGGAEKLKELKLYR